MKGDNMVVPDFPKEVTEIKPLEDILPSLGFVPNNGGYVKNIEGLKFFVCYSIWSWIIMRDGYSTKRTATPPHEVPIKSPTSCIELLGEIYKLWAEVFSHGRPSDPLLKCGKTWADYQRMLERNKPRPPGLRADPRFLRFCLNHIKQQYDWVKEDFDIKFTQSSGQILITAKQIEVHCPAYCVNWLGETTVSAKDLFLRLPKRFSGASLQQEGDKLIIDGHVIPARWNDTEEPVLPSTQ